MNTVICERRPVTRSAVGLVMACAVLWGGQSVAVKLAVEQLPAYRVMTLRFLLACLLIGGFALLGGHSLRLARRQGPMVLVAALLLFVQIGLFTVGTSLTTSVHSIVIISSFPLFAAVGCHYLLPGLPCSWQTLSGLLLALGGVATVFAGQLSWPDAGQLGGDLMVLAAAAVMGLKITYMKSLLRHLPPLSVVFWEAVVALPLFLLTSLCLEGGRPWLFSTPTLLAVLYQGCAVSGVAVLLWTMLLRHHAPSDVAVFRMATPLVGMLLGWLILSEDVTPYLLSGGLLLAAGIYRVTR